MGVYTILATLTDAGARDLEGIARRRSENVRELQHNGIRILADYALMGAEFDFLYIVEAPNEEVIMRQILHDTRSGLLKFRTMHAMPLDTFAELMRDKEREVAEQ